MTRPGIIVRDHGTTLQLHLDWGWGPYLALSVPTGVLAAYQEARDRGRAEAEGQIVTAIMDRGYSRAEAEAIVAKPVDSR